MSPVSLTQAPAPHFCPYILSTKLQLQKIGARSVISASGNNTVYIYNGDICFPQVSWSLPDIPIGHLLNHSNHYGGVIGRDIILQVVLLYDGSAGFFTFTVP